MTDGLKRYQQNGDFHFLTFSCYHRRPYLSTQTHRFIFEDVLEAIRSKYGFLVLGYVVMPEHVHLLITEPIAIPLAKALMALKISSSKRVSCSPLWQARYYDFNVYTGGKQVEKLKYIHRNPVRRGLVEKPEQWGGRVITITLQESEERLKLSPPGQLSPGSMAWLLNQGRKTIKSYRYSYPTLNAMRLR